MVFEQSRTVVAENLPEDHSLESMEQFFGRVGPVKMVRICSPEAANGANSTAAKHPKTDMVVSNKVRGWRDGVGCVGWDVQQ
jgi:La-related protein 7